MSLSGGTTPRHPVSRLLQCENRGVAAPEVISDDTWAHVDFISTVQQRGAAIIQARGASSAASAANAAIDTVKSLPLLLLQVTGIVSVCIRWKLWNQGRFDYFFPYPFRWTEMGDCTGLTDQ